MRFHTRTHQVPVRVATGAFIMNSGLSKSGADEEAAAGIHGMAAGTYPMLRNMNPVTFARLLARAEIVLGAALVLPVVPTVVAGAALTAFSASLLGLYFRTPGLREEGGIRPTQQGIPIAKDIWLLGIGASLLTEELTRKEGRSPDGSVRRAGPSRFARVTRSRRG